MRAVYVPDDPDPTEAARRIRALMGYAGLSRTLAARLLNTSVGTFDRMIGAKGNEQKAPTWKQLNTMAEACEVPNWFAADYRRLDEIVTTPLVSQLGGAAAGARSLRALRALEQIAEEGPRHGEETEPRKRPKRSPGSGS